MVRFVTGRGLCAGFKAWPHLARPRLETPPRCCVGAKGLALRVWARREVHHLDRQNIARLGALDVDRAGQHVHAIAAAGGAAARDGLDRRRPLKDGLHAGVALDHLVIVVARVMRGHLDDHLLPRGDRHLGGLQFGEVPPVHGLGTKGQNGGGGDRGKALRGRAEDRQRHGFRAKHSTRPIVVNLARLNTAPFFVLANRDL